jgi:hypothetical protein
LVTDWRLPESSPRASPEQIRRFLDDYGSAELRHRDELVPIMERNDPNESRIVAHDVLLDAELRTIYRIRAKNLASSPLLRTTRRA